MKKWSHEEPAREQGAQGIGVIMGTNSASAHFYEKFD